MSQTKVRPSLPLHSEELQRMNAYWRAANYLSVGQIYLLDNPLLREPLHPSHLKPRLLGHWGTTPGLNFIYVHLNRIIKARSRPTFSSPGRVTAGQPWSPTPIWKAATASTIPRSPKTWRE